MDVSLHVLTSSWFRFVERDSPGSFVVAAYFPGFPAAAGHSAGSSAAAGHCAGLSAAAEHCAGPSHPAQISAVSGKFCAFICCDMRFGWFSCLLVYMLSALPVFRLPRHG